MRSISAWRALPLMILIALLNFGSVHAQTALPAIDTHIVLDSDSIHIDGDGAAVNGTTVNITDAGVYHLTGTLNDGQVLVDASNDESVTLILDGVNLTSTASAPIYIKKAANAVILLADGSENFVSDASVYVYEDADDDEPNAAVFSDDDLLIRGTGSLTVSANFNDGIASKDSLTILEAVLNVSAVDDGIRGKDFLLIEDAQVNLNVQGDGLKSDNADDAALGYITIESGVFNIVAGGDAIQAETTLTLNSGAINAVSGGGSGAALADDVSAKGLKGQTSIIINGGDFTLNAADDAIHSNGTIRIDGGIFSIATGDDGIHADAEIEINAGNIDIIRAYEGIESMRITINGGNIAVVASDDGINTADSSETATVEGQMPAGIPGGMGGQLQPPGQGADGQRQFPQGGMRGGPGGMGLVSENHRLIIHGGSIVIDAGGDGLDANGYIEMHGGTLVIVGAPATSPDSALDYDGGFTMTGGFLLAVGSAQMMQAPDDTSTQYAFAIGMENAQPAGTLIHIQNSTGEPLVTFAPQKSYQAIVFSSPELIGGETYTIYLGGMASGSETNGLYTGGTVSGGSMYTNLTLSNRVTQIGGGGGFRGRGRPSL